MLGEIVRFVQNHRRFAVTSHSRPDGDSIGSSLGLALGLQRLGKVAHVYCADPHPQAYAPLPGAQQIQRVEQITEDYDALFVLECNDLDRPGIKRLDRFFVINIDHHPRTEPFGDLNWVDTTAAAVGEMVYYLLKTLKAPVDPDIATNLYAALLTDTGSFQFTNTRPQTFTVASELSAHGADPARIAQWVYLSEPESKLRLLGRILNTLEVHSSRRIAWVFLTQEMLRSTGAALHETEGIANYPLSIAGVVMVAFFREENEERFRVSLRSKDGYDVGSVAEAFGGGGHKNAAGLTVEGKYPEVCQQVVSALEKLL